MKQVTAWQCDHCKRTSIYKSSISRHEGAGCPHNPATRACATCANLRTDGDIDDEYKLYCSEGYSPIEAGTFLLMRNCPKWETRG